jgi:hypothetical protein
MDVGYIDIDQKVLAQNNILILGPPGAGKSFTQEDLMRQMLAQRQPFCFIDMQGPAYKRLVNWCAYKNYTSRNLALLDPSEGKYVKTVKFFRHIPGVDTATQSSNMVNPVLSIWGDQNANSYPVMFKILKILFTVVVEKQIPLTKAFCLLADKDALTEVVDALPDPYIKAVWEDLRKLPHFEWSRQVTPTMNRLFRIVQSKAIQRFLCADLETPPLDITFEETILVNLGVSGNLDPDAAKMFAVLLINNFYQLAKQRRGKDGKPPKPYYIYVDEWLVPTPDFARILAECRQWGLLMCLANQDLSQIKTVFGPGFADTILTLCQLQFCFGGINDVDATRLAREWGVEASEIRQLEDMRCMGKLPRKRATSTLLKELHQPFVRQEVIDQFEQVIARNTQAVPIQEADKALPKADDETNTEPVKPEQFFNYDN